jgi:hypothetical protein
MTTDEQSPRPSIAELEALSTDELRKRAFAAAERARDIGFLWELVTHLRASESVGSDDGSAGGLGESITGVIELVERLLGSHDGSLEPLLRARYISYLHTGD